MNTTQQFVLSTLIWGTTWIAITFQVDTATPELSVFWRFLIATFIMAAITRYKKQPLLPPMKQMPWVALMGLFYTLNYLFVYRAEIEISSGLVAVVSSAILFFNIILSRVFFGTRVTAMVMMGALIGFAGICSLFWIDIINLSTNTIHGAGYALAAAFNASLANMVALRCTRQGMSVLTMNVNWMFGVVIFTALYLIADQQAIYLPLDSHYLIALLYLAVFGSVAAFTLYLNLLHKRGPSLAGYVAILTPVVALVVSTLFEGLQWEPNTYLGVALILLGQWFVFRQNNRAKPTYPSK